MLSLTSAFLLFALMPSATFNPGYIFAFSAYIIWGLYPFFWSELNHVASLEILAHRILWCIPCGLLVLLDPSQRRQLRSLRSRRSWMLVGLSALCICNNWFLYIWMVGAGRVQDASLGYFMTPLMGSAIGVLIYKERLDIYKSAAFVLALIGVLYLVLSNGSLPLFAITLALTFAVYGPLRVSSGLGATAGVLVEAILLSPFALFLLWYSAGQNSATAFGAHDWHTSALLVIGGAMTFIPLALYAAGAKRLELNSLSIYFYTVPSLILFSALALGEQVAVQKLVCFGFIWLGLAVYSYGLLRQPKP